VGLVVMVVVGLLRGPGFPSCRHPGESRGPASGTEDVESWVPAFAGMTAVRGWVTT